MAAVHHRSPSQRGFMQFVSFGTSAPTQCQIRTLPAELTDCECGNVLHTDTD